MRVVVDREAGTVRLELSAAEASGRTEVAEGVTVLTGAAEQVVGVELRGLDAAELCSVTVALAGAADQPAAAPAANVWPKAAPTPPPTPYAGPVAWDPEAEAAMAEVPFFSRGRQRLAAIALARRRGLDRVTLDMVRASGR